MELSRRLQFLEDSVVVRMAQMGSLEAWDELILRFRGAVLRAVEQTVRSHELAQDVTQETFLLALRSLSQLREPERFAGWLYTIARQRARRVGQREARSETWEADCLEQQIQAQQGERENTPLDALLRAERKAALRALCAGLPPETRLILQLYYEDEWPVARIATFLSLPPTTIKWRLHAGRERLRRQLAAYYLGDEPNE